MNSSHDDLCDELHDDFLAADAPLFLAGETGVIGDEDRVRVTPTVGTPWRWICRVEVQGQRDRQPGGATGVLVSDRHVLTAAHVVHEAAQNMHLFSIRVVPALDHGDEPFGAYPVTQRPRLAPRYRPDAADRLDFDYALLTLDTAIGAKTFAKLKGQALCHWGSPSCHTHAVFARREPAGLNGKAVLTAGYPFSRGGKKLMCAAGMLHSARRMARTMGLTADATQGQSGSPIWIADNGRAHLVGLVVGAGRQSNTAIRVTRELVRQLRSWIVQDGQTPSMIESETGLDPVAAEAGHGHTLDDVQDAEVGRWRTTRRAAAPAPAAWAAGIDLFPPPATLAFRLDDPGMVKAFKPVTVSSANHLCAALVDLSGSALTPAYAGLNDEQMLYAGSLPKICAMYAAFALRAQVQALADAAAAHGVAPALPTLAREIDKVWRPKLRALFPTRPATAYGGQNIGMPQIERIFTISAHGKVDFARATPALSQAQLDAPVGRTSAEFKTPPGRFHEWMQLMLRWSNNTAASQCILALGYPYINGALGHAGLFEDTLGRGLWLSADFAGHDWVNTWVDWRNNAAGPALTPHWASAQGRKRSNATATAAQVARFMTLLALDRLVDPDACAEMRQLLEVTPGGIGSYANAALRRVGRSPIRIAGKIGYGDDAFSHDCAIVERRVGGKDLRYVATVLGSARGRKRQDLNDLFVLLDAAIVERHTP
jgi:V8-like Glu-specific endopeptidase